jgi:hypothetical protein
VLNQEAYAQWQDLYQQWVNAFGIEDPNEAFQTFASINAQAAQVAMKLYDIQEKLVDYTLDFTDELKVRKAKLPPVFDSAGKVRAYTAKELQELKGNSTLPGYIAKLEDLKAGQSVRVFFVKKKPPANELVLRTEPYLFVATAVVILDEPVAPKEP